MLLQSTPECCGSNGGVSDTCMLCLGNRCSACGVGYRATPGMLPCRWGQPPAVTCERRSVP